MENDARHAVAALTELLAQPEGRWSLAEGAIAIARLQRPGLAAGAVLRQLEDLGNRARDVIGGAQHPRFVAAALAGLLFDERGLSAPERGGELPECLFLDSVLATGVGTPTLLAIIFIEVARRTGQRFEVIALPGAVLLRADHRDTPHLFDPAREARPVTVEDCRRMVADNSNGKLEFREGWLRPVTREQVLGRLLGSLKTLYWRAGDYQRALSAIRLLLAIRSDDPREIRDSGRLHFLLGRYRDAIDAFESYLQVNPHGEDADAVRMLLIEARSGLVR